MNETLSYALAAVVLPPMSAGLLTLAGLILARRYLRHGLAVVFLSVIFLWAYSMPAVGVMLLRTLEPPPVDLTQLRQHAPQAIVILGGGRQRGALEWGGETVNAPSLQRSRYGAALARTLELPILITGGAPGHGGRPEAALMRDIVVREFNTEVRWVEEASLTTRDNARYSAQQLLPAGIRRIVLVTSASHMPRAQANFTAQGFIVLPAPTAYLGQLPLTWNLFIPSVEGLERSNIALREWLAISRDRVFGQAH